jgi:hypothetical protein
MAADFLRVVRVEKLRRERRFWGVVIRRKAKSGYLAVVAG